MLRGLRAVAADLKAAGIPFFLLRGDPGETVPALAASTAAGLVVADVSPLRLSRTWRAAVAAGLAGGGMPLAEVDAHNVVPVWGPATDKKEIGARTLRPRLHRVLPDFLTEFPALPAAAAWTGPPPPPIDWDAVIGEATAAGAAVPEVAWCVPGEAAARAALAAFATRDRLKAYLKRNDPNVGECLFIESVAAGLSKKRERELPTHPPPALTPPPPIFVFSSFPTDGLSNLSPYLHFGQLAPQRAALAVDAVRALNREAADSFLEEAVVRRELSDNFCWHEPSYDSLDGAAAWARESLELHAADPREHTYTRAQLEAGATHDDLWNAAQAELVSLGKMHGFMRMYWAKKILEWTPGDAGLDGNGPAYALATAIYLNDRYELDGRDPNGYVGCMWAIAGTHDMGWAERAVFGKIRYMNYAGCKRKFDVGGYVAKVRRAVAAEAARRGGGGGA